MLSFESDYTEGAHQLILQRLAETNLEQLPGYGKDKYCASAKEKIRQLCACPQAEIYFLAGGTQTNATVIDALLTRYQGVLAACTGHIATHEAGAIEFGGHKVLELPQQYGKIAADELQAWLSGFFADENHEHMVFPGLVYISHPTEYGALYSKQELAAIASVCREYGLPLYLDGARLGYGLMGEGADLTLPDIAAYCDAFYIGGTKVGALCGEAAVFTRNAPRHFMTTIKQHGALLAKGRLLGIQFDTLFTDGLYFRISRHAIEMARLLKDAFQAKGYTFYLNTPTNQIFIVLDNFQFERLRQQVAFGFWQRLDQRRTVVRFATSWATAEEDIAALAALL